MTGVQTCALPILGADIADSLGLGAMLEEYVLPEDHGKVVMKLRKL